MQPRVNESIKALLLYPHILANMRNMHGVHRHAALTDEARDRLREHLPHQRDRERERHVVVTIVVGENFALLRHIENKKITH